MNENLWVEESHIRKHKEKILKYGALSLTQMKIHEYNGHTYNFRIYPYEWLFKFDMKEKLWA